MKRSSPQLKSSNTAHQSAISPQSGLSTPPPHLATHNEENKTYRGKDLTGRQFGRLTVLGRGTDYISPKGRHHVRWLCQCECGNTTEVQTGTLVAGKSKSCGCLQRELARARASIPKQGTDLTNKRFGRLTALKHVYSKPNEGHIWECKCDCGNTVYLPAKHLNSGIVNSCGCLRDEKISKVNLIHGLSHKSRLYNVWVGMRQRCNDPNHRSYKNYGGRGISVCSEWGDFTKFQDWAASHGYDPNAKYGDCTLDRIDVNGNYEPSNCRWANAKEQAANKRKLSTIIN